MGYKCCCCIPAGCGLVFVDILTMGYAIITISIGSYFSEMSEVCFWLEDIMEDAGDDVQDVEDWVVGTCHTTVEPFMSSISILLIIIGALALLAAALHIYGVAKRRTRFMIPMMVWLAIAMANALLVASALFLITMLLPDGTWIEHMGYVSVGFVLAVTLLISYFLFIFIRYRHKVVKKERESRFRAANQLGMSSGDADEKESYVMKVKAQTVQFVSGGNNNCKPPHTSSQEVLTNPANYLPPYSGTPYSTPVYALPTHPPPVNSFTVQSSHPQPNNVIYGNVPQVPTAPSYDNPAFKINSY